MDELRNALQALLDWGREHTSPRDANSPHKLLIAAQEALACQPPTTPEENFEAWANWSDATE